MDSLPVEIVDVIISFRGLKMTEQEFKLSRSLNRQWKTFFEKKLFIYEQYDKKIFSTIPPKRNNDFVKIKIISQDGKEQIKGVLYRREYHNFSQDVRDLILEKTNKVGMITFNDSPFSITDFSATLFTKYLLDEKCYSSRPIGYEGPSTYFFDLGKVFELSNGNVRQGKLVKGRYPNHYDVFSLIYENKLGKLLSTKEREVIEVFENIREYGCFTPEMSDTSDDDSEANDDSEGVLEESEIDNNFLEEYPEYYKGFDYTEEFQRVEEFQRPAGDWDGNSWDSDEE